MLNGILYVLATGCQWRALPKDLPAKSTVHDYLTLWTWDGTLRRLHLLGWMAPSRHQRAKVVAVEGHQRGAIRHGDYNDRPGSGQDGLFAKDKFCLIRRGQLVLAQRRARSGSDRALPDAGAAVPRGSRPLGAGHEAAAVDRAPAAGRPSNGATAVGQGLSVASAGHRRARRPACSSGRSVGRRGGEPSCK